MLVALALCLVSTKAQETDCPLSCKHGSVCKKGFADFGGLEALNPNLIPGQDDWHCDCSKDDKHIGLTCETKYEVCDKKTTCFNGGKCTKQEDDGKWGCDCTAADGLFAGKYCESKATATCETADDGLETDSWFCVNNGSCRDNASNVNRKCSCPEGFKGPHCEVKKDTAVAEEQGDPEQCDLKCKQGGQCVHGFKDHAKEHKNIEDLYFLKKKEIKGMHCVCPEGFAGVQCDIKLDKCGGQYCYHGATCLQVRSQRLTCLLYLYAFHIYAHLSLQFDPCCTIGGRWLWNGRPPFL